MSNLRLICTVLGYTGVITESSTTHNLDSVDHRLASHKAPGHVDERIGFVISLASEGHTTSVRPKNGFNFCLNTRTDHSSRDWQIPLQLSELNFTSTSLNSLNHAASLKTNACCQNSYFVYITNSSVCPCYSEHVCKET